MRHELPSVVIIGGGPIGLACALLLAQRGIGSCVLDARPLDEARGDMRLLALSRGSWAVLDPLLARHPPARAAIREVFVSSAGDFGATRISAADFDGAELGATVLYGDLLAALADAVTAQPAIIVRRPALARGVLQRPDRIEVALDDGSVLTGGLAIIAEGQRAIAGAREGPPAIEDWALLADLRIHAAANQPPGAAFERFTRAGPLALLPTPKPALNGAGEPFSLVWCMSRASAMRRSALPDEVLRAQLQPLLGARIGVVASIGPRRAVPLPRQLRHQVQAHRVVALGNAAQTLHPVAGQGFNLGLRDCVTLADEITTGRDLLEALARYARRRRADRAVITSLTASLPALFASRFAPLALARGMGLAALDLAPALRRQLAQLLMFGVRL